uniref:Uncharacterized protein n=1 Tax=Medicago truncatula TaxID=3880 RepID=A2Q694_MEDTR|nr:hypothetical protein MtrDRAFT_AC174465g24v2 [Medicago truncatula]
MCGADSGTFVFDSDIDKTRELFENAIPEVREAATVPLPSLSDFSSDEKMGEPEHMTLGDYGRLDNMNEVDQRFQLVNHVLFDIKLSIFSALRENQFAGRKTEDSNAHLTNFLEACSTINLT